MMDSQVNQLYHDFFLLTYLYVINNTIYLQVVLEVEYLL